MAASLLVAPLHAQAPPLDAKTGGVLVGDMTLDQIYLTRDLNGDGDADDAGEAWVYFDETNASGIPTPCGSVFAIFQSVTGYVFFSDGSTDTVYRLRDWNGDGDALDEGEANVWFSGGDNFYGFLLLTPNGIYQDSSGATYILNAGTLSTPCDAIYRTEDLNGDGDANDENEATLWMDIENLMVDSSAFSLTFMDDVAYFADLVGNYTDTVFRAADADANGSIDATEFNVFVDEDSPFGVQVGTTIVNDGVHFYISESLTTVDPQNVTRLTDLNASGDIDDASEVFIAWDENCTPPGYLMGSSYGMAIGPGGELMVGSAGTDDKDNMFRLVDLNGDGDFLDDGETILWAKGNDAGVFIENPRSMEYILPSCVGDIDGDGKTGQSDLGILLSNWGCGGGCPGDLDGDGTVGQSDLGILLSDWGCGT